MLSVKANAIPHINVHDGGSIETTIQTQANQVGQVHTHCTTQKLQGVGGDGVGVPGGSSQC